MYGPLGASRVARAGAGQSSSSKLPDAIAPWLAAAPDDPALGWTAAQLAEHVRDEHSTFTWLLEPMLERVGLDVRHRWVSTTRTYATYTCIRQEERPRA